MSSATNDRRMTRSGARTLFVTSAALVALGFGTRTQLQAGQDVRPSSVESVDFVALSRTGQPVTDLKADEITIRVGNKLRPIRVLQFVRVSGDMVGAIGPRSAAPDATQPVEPAFATNVTTFSETPRSIVIVVDDESMPVGEEQKLHEALNQFVRDLPPTDLVSVVTVPHGGIQTPLTTDRAVLRKAIAGISPISPIEALPCRTRATLSVLDSTVRELARTSEQPVTVAFIGSNLVGASKTTMAVRPEATTASGGLTPDQGACNISTDDFTKVGKSLASVRAQLYIIHPDFSQNPAMEGIENLRGQTDAPLFHLVSNTEPGLSRMARETSGYYTAMFETQPDDRAGQAQPSAIKTTRPDVELRARPYVVIGRTAAKPGPATSSAGSSDPTMTTTFEMVRSERTFRELPLRVTRSVARSLDGTLNVLGVFEPVDASATIMSAAAVLFDDKGRGVAYWTSESGKMTSWPTVFGLAGIAPGDYRLRVAAIDSNGRRGLVEDKFTAGLQKAGPVQIGGLVLGLSRGGAFAPRLQFSTEASAVAYVELYGGSPGMQLKVLFEVSKTTDGPAFLTLNGAVDGTGEEGKFMVTGTLPVGALDPGDYVVRAIIQVAGQPAGRVIRTLHKAG